MMRIFIVTYFVFSSTLSFSKANDESFGYLNNSFMFKPVILSNEDTYNNIAFNEADPCSTIFSVNEEPEISSFQEQFKDYPFILYLDDIYQSVYRYSNLNTVIFENENNNLYLFSRYDFNKNKIKFSIKYNFK